ncbi:MAG: DUF2290 domain-containing protein [Nitrospirales bacterium]|nr:DUF2290 domain-containing protein [Nitrospirales bacterium]
MTPNNIRQDISTFAAYLLGEGLVIGYHGPVLKKYGALSYVSSPWFPEVTVDDETGESDESQFTSVGEYLFFLQEGFYTIVLFDGALIQVAFSFQRGEITKHRLGYYPCPIELDFRGEACENLCEIIEEELTGKAIKSLNCRSSIRFDFDSYAARNGHSASHVHMNRPETRIPAYGPIKRLSLTAPMIHHRRL